MNSLRRFWFVNVASSSLFKFGKPDSERLSANQKAAKPINAAMTRKLTHLIILGAITSKTDGGWVFFVG
jgi:hypothetical protein